jgi:hypothetical protein
VETIAKREIPEFKLMRPNAQVNRRRKERSD